jgi:hypothetical protein
MTDPTIRPISPADPVVFLDIDGVLNPHAFDPVAQSNRIDHDKVILLNFILSGRDARIVLSSAWRYLLNRSEMTLSGLDWLLRSHGVRAGSLAGITHPDTPTEWDEERGVPVAFVENERAAQVRRWRAANGHRGRYVVIDDLDLGFTAAGMPFVQTEGSVGLTAGDVDRANEILRGDIA